MKKRIDKIINQLQILVHYLFNWGSIWGTKSSSSDLNSNNLNRDDCIAGYMEVTPLNVYCRICRDMPDFEKVRKMLLYPGTETEVRNMLEMHSSLTHCSLQYFPVNMYLLYSLFFFCTSGSEVTLLPVWCSLSWQSPQHSGMIICIM